MANQSVDCARETRLLVVAMTDFLRDQIISRSDLRPDDKHCLQVAIDKLLTIYGAEGSRYVTYRGFRPLLDVFSEITNPISVKDKIQADCHKESGNDYMKRIMFEKAETEYTKAIELDKWDAIYYTNRAVAKIGRHNNFGAISDCRQALMISPDYAKAHARLGQAYALLHRPSDAARCFSKALDLEPENEKYRSNLRVAENEINRHDAFDRPDALGRPDAAQMINNLLGSLSRFGPQIAADNNYRMIPTSVTIIAERHSPAPRTLPQIARKDKSTQISETSFTKNSQRGNKSFPTATNRINNITFRRSFVVADATEKPKKENPGETGEFMVNTPLPGFSATTRIQSSFVHDESRIKHAEIIGSRPSEKLRINVNGEKTFSQRGSNVKPNGLVNAHVTSSGFKGKITKQNDFLCDKIPVSDTQNHNQSEKLPAQASTSEVKAETKKKEVKKNETTLFTMRNSFAKAFTKQKCAKNPIYTNGESNDGGSSVKNLFEEVD